MDILIIGNGFDLAHHLDTKYTDFLKYCRGYNEENPISDSDEMNEEFLAFIKDNVWLSYFLKITPDLDTPKTWIDFEKEISGVIHFFENKPPTIKESDFDGEKKLVLFSLLRLMTKHFNRFYRCFLSSLRERIGT